MGPSCTCLFLACICEVTLLADTTHCQWWCLCLVTRCEISPEYVSQAAQPWFRGFQTREDAFEELQGQSPGTFVVRVSNSEPGVLFVSMNLNLQTKVHLFCAFAMLSSLRMV